MDLLSKDEESAGLGTCIATPSQSSKVICVFTSRGAQWTRIGAELGEPFCFTSRGIAEMDAALQKKGFLLHQLD